jgi:mRNA-degrading endonuclease RelE of RelBE toxin-antitoxin system
MPAATTNGDAKDFEVDPGFRIGLDALAPEDQRIVEEAIRSKEDFLARISDPGQVYRLRPKDPYFALKITPRLRIIYTREGDRITVEILTNQGFLDRYASMGGDDPAVASRKRSASDRRRHGPHEGSS